MSNAKRGLKALGLSLLAAMGLMAFLAAGAQADFDVNGTAITKNQPANGEFVPGTEGLLLVPAQNLVIHCKKFKVEPEATVILPKPDLDAHVAVLYEECVNLVKGVASPGCKPEILLVSALVKPILHSGKVYLLASPKSGANFTVIHYNEGTCALPPLPAVTGSVVFECTNAGVQLSCAHPLVTQTIRPAPVQTLFPEVAGKKDGLQYGLNAAEIHGESRVFLTGENSGKTFNALI